MHYRKDIGWRALPPARPLRLGVLGSTRGTDLQAIFDAMAVSPRTAVLAKPHSLNRTPLPSVIRCRSCVVSEAGRLAGVSVAAVVSNKDDAPILDRARRHRVPQATPLPLPDS
jgi:folate-dependent phosphoribosylglycinamide formyltransferase PurN